MTTVIQPLPDHLEEFVGQLMRPVVLTSGASIEVIGTKSSAYSGSSRMGGPMSATEQQTLTIEFVVHPAPYSGASWEDDSDDWQTTYSLEFFPAEYVGEDGSEDGLALKKLIARKMGQIISRH